MSKPWIRGAGIPNVAWADKKYPDLVKEAEEEIEQDRKCVVRRIIERHSTGFVVRYGRVYV